MSRDPDPGPDLVHALGLDPGCHDRDLLWDLVQRLEAASGGDDLDGLVRDLVLNPAVDPVLD